tara:strand:- start:12758 stop:13144 length:387 start_codon:yes stop_codon:yes gene_type:complete
MKMKYLILVLVFSIIIPLYYYTKKSTDYSMSKSEFSFNNVSDFNNNHNEYVSKVIDIYGEVSHIIRSSPSITLKIDDEYAFNFNIDDFDHNIQEGMNVRIKARYVGYDDLFGEYSFTDCLIINSFYNE